LKLEQHKQYTTKAGNIVKCLAVQADKDGVEYALCAYIAIKAEGHENLMNSAQKWSVGGKWLSHPGGIHDIVE
jgi:hypothetical protein